MSFINRVAVQYRRPSGNRDLFLSFFVKISDMAVPVSRPRGTWDSMVLIPVFLGLFCLAGATGVEKSLASEKRGKFSYGAVAVITFIILIL